MKERKKQYSFWRWSKLWGSQIKLVLGLIYSNLKWKTLQTWWVSVNLTSAFKIVTLVFWENILKKNVLIALQSKKKGDRRPQIVSIAWNCHLPFSLSVMYHASKEGMSLQQLPLTLFLKLVLGHLLLSSMNKVFSDSQKKVYFQHTTVCVCVRERVISRSWLLL